MSNQLATSSLVAREALAVLENMLTFSNRVNRDWEDEFSDGSHPGYKSGQTINIKKPPRYRYRAGRVAVPQATVEPTIPLTISQGGVDIAFSSMERTVSLSGLQDKLRAAMAPVANEIDSQGMEMARLATYNTLNAAGTVPVTQADAVAAMAAVNRRLDEMAAPVKDGRRHFIMGPALNAGMIQGYSGLFNSGSKIDQQYNTGYMQDSFGLHPGMDQNVPVHTNGAATATNIAGAGQTGSSITVVATTGGTLTKGTTIQLPNVQAVNPQSRRSTGVLADFVVTEDVPVGSTTIPISPAIVVDGAFQNVTQSPTTGQPYAIRGTVNTTYTENIGFHRDAFTLAMVPLWKPPENGVLSSERVSHKGFQLRVIEFYDGTNDNAIFRIDVAFGWAAPYPELAVKYRTV